MTIDHSNNNWRDGLARIQLCVSEIREWMNQNMLNPTIESNKHVVLFFNDLISKQTKFKCLLCTKGLTANNVCLSLFLGFQILCANICLRTFLDIVFTLVLKLVIKSEMYDILSVHVHFQASYTSITTLVYMYMHVHQ